MGWLRALALEMTTQKQAIWANPTRPKSWAGGDACREHRPPHWPSNLAASITNHPASWPDQGALPLLKIFAEGPAKPSTITANATFATRRARYLAPT